MAFESQLISDTVGPLNPLDCRIVNSNSCRPIAGLHEDEAVLVVSGTATVGMLCGHDPLAAASRHADRRPPRLALEHPVPGAPATADAAVHHQRLTLDAQPSTRNQQLGPLAERRPAARSPTLRQSKLRAVAVVDVAQTTKHNWKLEHTA